MDFAIYPKTEDNVNKTLNRIDKLRDSIKISRKKLEEGQKLTKKQKQTLMRFISNDFAFNLSTYLQKRAIKLQSEIGMEGCRWNILHFACKFNSLECIQFALKQQFHSYPNQYEKFIDSKTVEGYTPAMISIINESNDALSILLKYGAVNIHSTDNKRMTAYELAINYKNQRAIRMLMNYQNQPRKQKVQCKSLLNIPIHFVKVQQGCCYRSFLNFFQCLTLGLYSNISSEQGKTTNSSPRRSSFLHTSELIYQQVKISKQPHQQAQYEIVWKDISDIITNLKYPLFESYNPFDITQKNIVIKNNLILFQSLSQHSWLIRKLVQIDRNKQNHFNINLFLNFQLKNIGINKQIPFLKDRQQPMFIENHNQMWPMLLQKGLAKAHGSYFQLQDIKPIQLVQQMTGFPTFQLSLSEYDDNELFYLLKQIHQKGYLNLLQGIEGSSLSNEGKKDIFSILQFFDKNQKKLILINCPFVNQDWKQKQKYDMHSLKLIKSHFNNHDQMCVWIQSHKIKDYFSKIIVSTTLPNYERRSFKLKAKNEIFFTYKVNKKRDEKIFIQLVNLQTKKSQKTSEIRSYMNDGDKRVNFRKGIEGQNFIDGVFSTESQEGQYMCCIQINDDNQSELDDENIAQSLIHSDLSKKSVSYMLIMWSIDATQPRYVDQTLGTVQFLNWINTNSIKTWSDSQIYRVQIASDYALIIIKDRDHSQKMYLSFQADKDDLIQGKYISENTIELVKNNSESKQAFFYCILRRSYFYGFTKKSSYIKDPNNLDPAGQSSIGKKLSFFTQ